MSSSNFQTDDIVVRAAEPGDHVAVKEIYAQAGAYTGTLQLPYPSAQTWKQRLEQPPPGSHVLVACIDDLPIGNIGLMPEGNPRRRHSGSLGMGVHDKYAGRGVGHKLMEAVLDIADNWINLTRVELSVYTDNDRAIRLYERHGFETEGVLRQYAFRDGRFVDALTMARLRHV